MHIFFFFRACIISGSTTIFTFMFKLCALFVNVLLSNLSRQQFQ
uniref:Uncharacterized protein n=1 Tax=Arundo donax TaxID=35708 RepID=A0A0A9G5W0_ARUDO